MAGLSLSVPISLAIVALLFIVVFSYRQTVYAYPQGGGAFNVARENLGTFWGLFAAAALLVGYVLTVAVSIAAGVNAIVSALPALLPYRVLLNVLFIALMTLINLRGVRESGAVFAPPTYGFVLTFAILILLGLWRGFTGDAPCVALSTLSGRANRTQRDAGSDGVRTGLLGADGRRGDFRRGAGVQAARIARNAATTLLLMAFILSGLVLGITYTAFHFHITPRVEHGEIVGDADLALSARRAGRHPLRVVLLCGAGCDDGDSGCWQPNTAYMDFPRLSSILANARFAPRQLANLGDRLVF
jgi:amino acid transporter